MPNHIRPWLGWPPRSAAQRRRASWGDDKHSFAAAAAAEENECPPYRPQEKKKSTRKTAMDPLSITLSAITLVQVASSVYNMAVSYGKSVSGLPGEVQSLISEIKLLEEVLQNLHDTFQEDSENPGNSTGTKKNDFLKPSMDECKEQLEILYSYLEKGKSKRRRLKNFGRRLKWPMKVQDTTEWILRMERFKGTFSLALQTESLGVQQKTHGEVEEIRLAQERDRIEEKRRKQSELSVRDQRVEC
jgi:hypothetical protein